MSDLGDQFDVRRFAGLYSEFLQDMRRLAPPAENPLKTLVADHLGSDPSTLPTITDEYDVSEHPNVQLAFDSLQQRADHFELVGLPAELRFMAFVSLASLLAGRVQMTVRPGPPEYVNRPISIEASLPCVQLGLFLVRIDGEAVAAAVSLGQEYGPRQGLNVEVMAADRAVAERFTARLRTLAHEHDVYRGKLLSFAFTERGQFDLTFHRLPPITREQVILPAEDLEAIERHTVGLTERAASLREARRHLKRGLLLYGPPGTGKTYSIMYLCNRMPERTTILLSGPAAGALGRAGAIARSLQPAMIVLEDVDLVAEERTMSIHSNPLLFQLLNEMDGLAEDADVIFVLTTNRVDLLEPALADRPGRIDEAVEIKLPEADCRRRLFELYLTGVDHEIGDLGPFVTRTEGVSAAFVKELVRRAMLTNAGDGSRSLTATDLSAALDRLLATRASVLRNLLGAASAQGAEEVEQ